VIVARERRRGEVLDAVLDPFHRLAGDDGGDRRADVAGIGADLVAKAAADVGRDHMDLLLRQLGDQRHHGADDMRGLEGAPDRQLALILSKEQTHWQVSSGDGWCGDRRSAP
jgi:hypothetical protein